MTIPHGSVVSGAMRRIPTELTSEEYQMPCAPPAENPDANRQPGARAQSQVFIILTGFTVMITLTVIVGFSAALYISSDEKQDQPQITFEYDYIESEAGDEGLSIRHVRGEKVNPDQLYIEVSEAVCTNGSDPNGRFNVHTDFGQASNNWLKAGNSIVLDEDSPEIMCEDGTFRLDDATVTIKFQEPNGNMVVLDRWEAS